jgi:hypothetical protein
MTGWQRLGDWWHWDVDECPRAPVGTYWRQNYLEGGNTSKPHGFILTLDEPRGY